MIQSATLEGGQERIVTDLNKRVNENASPIHVLPLFIQKYIEVVIKAGHRRKEVVLPDKEDKTTPTGRDCYETK